MTTPVTRSLTGLATAGILIAALAGCSDDDAAKTKAQDDASKSASSTSQRISPDDLPTAPALAREKGAVKDVTVGNCPATKGDNTVEGKVTNPTGSAKDYVITISWVTPRSDVVARGIATVRDVDAGETKSWRTSGDIATDGTYSCTTQVLRGQLRG